MKYKACTYVRMYIQNMRHAMRILCPQKSMRYLRQLSLALIEFFLSFFLSIYPSFSTVE